MIYPINEMISNLMESFTNRETGELIDGVSEETIEEAIGKLQIDFNEKVDALCGAAKNYKAEAADIKVEKMNLAKRQSSAEKAAERVRKYLSYLLDGEKFKNGRHNVYYLTTQELVVDSEEDLAQWCKMNAPEYLNKPTLRIEDIKRDMKAGKEIPFAHLKNNRSVVVR